MKDVKEFKEEVVEMVNKPEDTTEKPTIMDFLDVILADGWEDVGDFPCPDEIYGKEFKEGWYYITLRSDKKEAEYRKTVEAKEIRDALSPIGRDMMGMIPKDVENTIENFLNDLRWYMTNRYKNKYIKKDPKHEECEEVDRKINEIKTAINGFIAIEQEN